ncbi:hypothetical protein NE237_016037 [Protea cynaroides]|uniref:Uncharacterized protein n=1 Tax=Protea cynaroides TaxID=273540 RepID=A0A9Q0KFF7_9MAGN|nr:hypothetical protein NE237_016037 [Protea cynaroides]
MKAKIAKEKMKAEIVEVKMKAEIAKEKTKVEIEMESLEFLEIVEFQSRELLDTGFPAAAGTLRSPLISSMRKRGGGEGLSRWTSPGHQDRPNSYIFNRIPLPPGHFRKLEDINYFCFFQ